MEFSVDRAAALEVGRASVIGKAASGTPDER
jgi:hypothetical protein